MPISAPHPTTGVTAGPLPRRVWLLSWVSCVADISGEMTHPVLPMFLIGVLGASMTQVGLLDGVAVLLVALLNAFAGASSDRTRRRVPWVRAGYALPILGKALIALASSWWLAFAGRSLDRFGKGLRGAPRDAMLAEAVSPELHGRVFGLHRAIDTAGAVVGGLISAALLWWMVGTLGEARAAASPAVGATLDGTCRLIFWIAAGIGVVALALALLVRDKPGGEPDTTTDHAPEAGSRASVPARHTKLSRAYWAALGVLTLFSLGASSDAFLLLRAREAGFSPWMVVLLYVCFNVSYAACSYPAGKASDRRGRWRVIGAGWAIYAVAYAAFALVPAAHGWALWPLMVVYGLSIALTEGVGKALVADLAPPDRQGTAMGVFHCVTGVAALLASVLAGVAWDTLGSTAALLLGAGCAALSILGLLGLHATGAVRLDGPPTAPPEVR